MYLVDTNVISEVRKGTRANAGVRDFFKRTAADQSPVFLSVVTVGELRRGVELIRHRGDVPQANRLEKWLQQILLNYEDYILDIDSDVAQLWGRLRVPNYENALDKLIAASALIHNLTVVTRNSDDFSKTGVRTLDPFSQ
ncbi:MAG: type II toxin-antitoxin system VapC family toxin [Gammaproteobacteria bacterium]|nr:type II toxin-antitoxin system VapC family toxin [Gammaproteobacteria bacterium]